ncbi:Folylpolyglutamate synthetase [Coemansia erecta]|uniref:Folylpolyglutamate synthase n=1 Tax=Coemansia erecta TaxID=147472 RepID=A0A9W7Y4B9_9FUNG|nr:Folylpolyglutamate synthetase [Coemansia erecta]
MNRSAVNDLNSLQTNHEIIKKIKESGGRLNKFSIPEFESFVEKLGHQVDDLNRLNVIHVTGTKGKGSTCAFVSSILRQVNAPRPLKIGLFTSPHLIEVRERIQINGQPISQEMFAKYFYQVFNGIKSADPPLRLIHPHSPTMPMYFRFLTLMAYHLFLEEGVDVAIMEVGVGGMFDSTNVIRKPVVCGIASLGIDHQNALGTTIEQIAWHKAGIIKTGVPAFTVPQSESALEVIKIRASECSAPLSVVPPLEGDSQKLGVPGNHQRTNAALATALCGKWIQSQIPDASADTVDSWISNGLSQASWPGRSQTFVSPRHPSLVWHVDGAHTVESIAACGQWFAAEQEKHTGQCVLLFNAAHDRNVYDLLATLRTSTSGCNFAAAVFCPNLSSRADSNNFTVCHDANLVPQRHAAEMWTTISSVTNTAVLPTINAAVEYIESTYGSCGVETHVLTTGSLHLVGGVLDAAKGSI